MMMNFAKFVIEVGKTWCGTDVDKKKLEKCLGNSLPKPLRGVDFSQHFHASDWFIYGSNAIAYYPLRMEDSRVSCEVFKNIFNEFLNLEANLEIKEVIYEERKETDCEGRLHDDSFSYYLVSWIVML